MPHESSWACQLHPTNCTLPTARCYGQWKLRSLLTQITSIATITDVPAARMRHKKTLAPTMYRERERG